jgi:hypothetical protein
MRLFTRQRRELNDDCCYILLSYYDNWYAAIFARVVARVAYYIINTTKCATAVCCSTRAPDADDLSSRVVYWHLAFDQSAGTPVSWEFKTCHFEFFTRGMQWHPVATRASSGNKWQQVSPGGSAIAFRFAPRRPTELLPNLGRRIICILQYTYHIYEYSIHTVYMQYTCIYYSIQYAY